MKKIGNYFFPDTDIHFQRWVLDGEYQKKQRDELFLKMNSIKPIKRICDIGGHVGTWSVPMAQYKDTEMIYAFEPNEKVRECFVENTLPFKDKVKVFNVALGDKTGFAWLDVEEENTGNTRIWVDDETSLKTVEVRTLDSFKLKDIDYMKIDVEGFELPVLQGAVETIKDSKPFVHVEMKTKRMLDKREDFENFFKTIDYKMILRTGSEELYYI